jgi:hypothetical protein
MLSQNEKQNMVADRQMWFGFLPWSVVAGTEDRQPEERMMWAQSGLNRLQVACGDVLVTFRTLVVKRLAGGARSETGRSAAGNPARQTDRQMYFSSM